MRRTVWLIPAAAALLSLAGCDLAQSGLAAPNGAEPASARPSEVLVSVPVERQVTDFEDFTGRTDAVAAVEVRAQVTGYLEKLNFIDGSDVKKGDVLFLIDDRPYTAELHRAQATLKQAEAHVTRLEADLRRAKALLARRAIGREEFDRIAADRAEAEASVGIARASLETAKLNLEFTKVIAPISGRISRRLVDPGNLVQADDTLLTAIGALDPMYAYFDIDERTLLRLQRLMRRGKSRRPTKGACRCNSGWPTKTGIRIRA